MVRTLCCVIFLLALSGAAAAAPFTLVAFNVESGDASDHVIAVQLENSVGVDLWGLADVWDEGGWPERLREGAGVGEDATFGAVLGQTGRDSRLLVLYREDRFRQLAIEEIAAARVSDREPAPLAVQFRLDGDQDFWFLVVDLSDSEGRRMKQARALADWTSRQTLPVVAGGTFRFGVKSGHDEDPAMGVLLESGWRWVLPVDFVATACGSGNRIEDFVFLAGPGDAWGARSEIMYPQSNYCPDSGRTSNHRPVLANLKPAGGVPVITGSMPERQVRPFFPDRLDQGGDRAVELANEVASVTPSPAPTSPAATQTSPVPAPESTSPAPDVPAEAEPTREDLLRRLEALEAEAERLRRQIEVAPD
jgi:hypothetical protein